MAGTPWDIVAVSPVTRRSPAPSEPDPSLVSCSEGVFKCPEDQLPLDYAKVSLERGRGTPLRGDVSVTCAPSPRRRPRAPRTRLAQPRRPGTGARAEARALCAAGPGNGNPLPTKGACSLAGGGDPAPGSVPVAPSQAGVGGPCAPRSPVRDADAPALPPQIYPDPELEAQVLSLAIRCIHSEEGCRWSGLIKHLQVGSGRMEERGQGCAPRPPPPHRPCAPQAHLGTCGFNVIPCPNRCSAKLSRRDLPEHVQHGCPKRRVKCEFCASDFTGEAFEVGDGSAGGLSPCRGAWPWWGHWG